MRRRVAPWLGVVLGLVAACDSKAAPSAAAEPAKAATPDDDGAQSRTEQRKREREQKAADEAKAKLDAEAKLDALAVLPAKKPKNLDAACKQMLAAYDGFMKKVLVGDMLTKWSTGGNEMQLAVFRKECLKRNVDVAACQAQALTSAGPELEPQLAAIMGKCADKFGAAVEPSAPPSR
jgi:hypothetical protein